MERYLLFLLDEPQGGWHDFDSAYKTLRGAQGAASRSKANHHIIVDLEEKRIVEEQFKDKE